MIRCPHRLFLLALITATTLQVSAQSPEAAAPNTPPAAPVTAPSVPAVDEEMVDGVKLSGGEIDLVLSLIEMWTGRTVLRPQQLPTPTFTINLNKRVPKSEAILALETLLNLNGIGLVPVGDKFVKVVDLPRVRMEAPQLIEGSTLDMPPSGRIASKLFQLEFQRVTEFLPQINMLLNGNMGGYVVFEKSNAALVTDSISTLQRIETLIKRLDQPLTTGMTPKFYTIHFAKASDLVNKINAIIAGPLQSQLGSATKFSADDRTNQIVLLSDPRQHAFFDDLISKLDVKADPNTRNEVIYLKHATAKDVATLLSQLISGATKTSQSDGSVRPGQIVRPGVPGQVPEPTPPPSIVGQPMLGELAGSNEFSGLINIQADERSNAVVVSGTVDDIRLIQELVEKIDVLLAQVRIEVVIAEVTLGDSDSTGIDALGLQINGDKLVGVAAQMSGLEVGGPPGADGTSSGFATISRPGVEGFLSGRYDLAGVVGLTTTPRKNNSHILSNPNIVTTHNKEARIFVGEQRPVISSYLNDGISTGGGGTNSGTGYRSTVNSKDIGIELKVKPLIGGDGSVQLDITQVVNDVLGDIIIDGNPQPRIGRRETQSFVSVKSGEIVVLGGLQRQSTSRSTSRLGPIPFIGDLLGKRTKEKSRTDLVFFLRPYVLANNSSDNEDALERLEQLPNKNEVKRALDPSLAPEEKSPALRPSMKRPR